MRAHVTEEQVANVQAFQKAYPQYSKDDIIEIAATPKFIPQLYKEAELLKCVTLNELAMILNGCYEIKGKNYEVYDALDHNPVLSAITRRITLMDAPAEAKEDALKSLFNQTAKGIKKYGAAVDYKSLSPVEWLQHEIEEATDGLVYKQALLLSLKESENPKVCSHENLEYWNHGYHNRCKDCGEVDVK